MRVHYHVKVFLFKKKGEKTKNSLNHNQEITSIFVLVLSFFDYVMSIIVCPIPVTKRDGRRERINK